MAIWFDDCYFMTQNNNRVCSECGNTTKNVVKSRTADGKPISDYRFCPYCGAEMEIGDDVPVSEKHY